MCWDLLGKADKRRHSRQAELDTGDAWQTWLTNESELRLVTCVRVLECLGHIFLGTPLVFNLRDATRQLPCSEMIWQSRNASDWKLRQDDNTGSSTLTDCRVHYMTDHFFRTSIQARCLCCQGHSSGTIYRRQESLPPIAYLPTSTVVVCVILEL
jgi:hypothetical protein